MPRPWRCPSVEALDEEKHPVVLLEGGDLRTQPRRALVRRTTLVTAVIALTMSATVTVPTFAGASTSHAYEAMPNVIGLGQSELHYAMYRAQLYYKTQGPGADSPRWVRVVGEIPAAGTPVPVLSTVILEVTDVPLVVHVTKAPVASKKVVKKKPVVRVVSITHKTTTPPKKKVVTKHVASSPTDFRVGVATWYDDPHPFGCATKYLPFGLTITVKDLATGKSITCLTDDREGAGGNRVVDLSETEFAELAPLSTGVVPVRVTW